MKNNIIYLIILVSLAFTACNKDLIDPEAAFEASETSVVVGQEIVFTVTGSGDFWSFWPKGDNESMNVEEDVFRYAYTTPGIYNAKIIASNLNEDDLSLKRDSAVIQITVADSEEGKHTSFSEYKFILKKVFTGFEDKPTIKLYIDGVIEGKQVTVEVPFSTQLDALKAIYVVPTSSSVYVGNDLQNSGSASNDFTNPVEYNIISNDGTEVISTVNVVKLPISDNTNLLSFDLGGLPAGVSSVVENDGSTFNVILSDSIDLSSQKSKFVIYTFARAYIDDVEQTTDKTLADFSSGAAFTVKAENGSESVYDINVLFTPGFTRFYFGEDNSFVSEGYYNSTKDTIFVDAPLGYALSSLTASFDVVPYDCEVKIGSVIQESGVSVNDFSSAVNYTLMGDVAKEIVVKVVQ